jgi:TRAP-type C4-dicarboxylate transport system permease small subunit
MGRLGKGLDALVTGCAVLAAGLLGFVTFSISYSILARAVGWSTPIWTVQFNEYALLWTTFLGSAWVLRRGGHVNIDLIIRRLSPGGQHVASQFHRALGASVCGILAVFTGAMVWDHYQRGVVDVQAIDVPKAAVLFVIPFGFALLAAQFLRGSGSGPRAESGPDGDGEG